MSDLAPFWTSLRRALAEATFVKFTLGKSRNRDQPKLLNVYVRPVELKGELMLQLNYRYADHDETKNLPPEEGIAWLQDQLGGDFLSADLFTTQEQVSAQLSRKGKVRLHRAAARHERAAMTGHDRVKRRGIPANRPYLRDLGISGQNGEVLAAGRDKFRQINKFVEIVDGLVNKDPLVAGAEIVDMGSGKGYLTFALYDHLTHNLGLDVRVTGVELRPNLVEKCESVARAHDFKGLRFVEGYIDNYRPANDRLDVLIALHACDTATDDALLFGLRHQARIMLVAPCCQKQVRRDLEPTPSLRPLLRHGILQERQAAMLTDALRALYLEREGYRTKIFEFIPLEHTAKNIMISATRAQPRPAADTEIRQLMELFGVQRHHLGEKLGQLAEKLAEA